jgi:hypothetical protein
MTPAGRFRPFLAERLGTVASTFQPLQKVQSRDAVWGRGEVTADAVGPFFSLLNTNLIVVRSSSLSLPSGQHLADSDA